MLFNSWQYVAFFPIVLFLYFTLPQRFRWALLLLASCLFYMAFIPAYILILFFTIFIDYFAGIWIENAAGPRRKLFLTLSIFANVGVLAIFKYYPWVYSGLSEWLGASNPLPEWHFILPIGLSFHTFQAMSYTIEVYRGTQKAERHLGIYALYVMFFPQLVAGPIERPQNLLHQFREEHTFEYRRAVEGMRLILWGLFKKMVIADRMAEIANVVYAKPESYAGTALIVATYAFAVQIYCDFSGYSDIARGSAQAMGFRLMENFNTPYLSGSVGEFWRRWHISLSTWFKDYVYVPLGGNRAGSVRSSLNLLITFLISGLWHGANLTFVVWGALHGFYLIIGRATAGLRQKFVEGVGLTKVPRLWHALQLLITFHLVCVGWIFFRAASLKDAWYVLTHLFAQPGGGAPIADKIVFAAVLVVVLAGVELFPRLAPIRERVWNLPAPVRWAGYLALLLAIFNLGSVTVVPFIYFQF